ncbi:hypothetical protein [Planctomicrobium sp. SH527]|uniref:hypothetical protein n=1 Tax=Planctomicrobium sp. SH527 TaxID=3448123 RepID=UPI003F5BAFA6
MVLQLMTSNIDLCPATVMTKGGIVYRAPFKRTIASMQSVDFLLLGASAKWSLEDKSYYENGQQLLLLLLHSCLAVSVIALTSPT